MMPAFNYSIGAFIWGSTPGECWACKQPTNYIEVNFESFLHPGLCEAAVWSEYDQA